LFHFSHLSHSHLQKIVPLAIYKTMSKDNARNNYSSTNYAKILIKFLFKRKKEESKKHEFTSKWV
jgi:hypothetical protein